jgi:hypothetical protein
VPWSLPRQVLGLTLLAFSQAAAAAPEEPGVSLQGSGGLTLADITTVAPGRFTLALTLDNKDRDPLGIDVLDYALAWAFGVGPRLEAYGHHVLSRVVSMPEAPALPPPPLDLVVADGGAIPSRPYYALYAPTPYVNKQGSDRFDRFLPGDFVFGLKQRLLEPRGARPGLALALQVEAPLTQALGDLQSGAGTGGADVTTRVIAEWRPRGYRLVASGSYTRVGKPRFSDHVILAGSAQAEAGVVDQSLDLPDRVELGLGGRRRISPRIEAVVEAMTALEVGARTPVLDRAWPADALAGIQVRWAGSRWTLGLRYHGHSPRSGESRAAPLAGAVDLSAVRADDRRTFLDAAGLGPVVPALRPDAQTLLLPGARALPPLPEGARLIPPSYRVRSDHQVGFVIAGAWAF